ncbi:glycosyltransferase 87 family protein [Psychromarinibacter sp. S121]|uniref:glycosyltransferase 87 family protein n=1 Tax=Psychromarinibacter sp. S121 TaxID=3415127 RepID=UPI003C7E58BF
MPPTARLLAWTVALALPVIALAVGLTHDHADYLKQWLMAAEGIDPWITALGGRELAAPNAYGPLHLLLAPLAAWHPLLPKSVFALCAVLAFALLLAEAGRPDARRVLYLALLFPLAPLVVIAVLIYGINDIVPALLTMVACSSFARNRRTTAGILLAFAGLYKFYPLLFAGFLTSRGDGRLDLRVPLVAAAVFAVGMAAAYAVWGESLLTPLRFGSDRPPKMLSILRLFYQFEPLKTSGWMEFLLAKNSLFVLATAVLVALHGWLARLDWEVTLLIGILAVFAVYKVGHAQFYVTWIGVQAWIIARSPDTTPGRVARGFLPLAAILSLYELLYFASGFTHDGHLGGPWYPLRWGGSVPFLLTLGWCVWQTREQLFRPWRRPSGLRL